jgi:hypothetical protein
VVALAIVILLPVAGCQALKFKRRSDVARSMPFSVGLFSVHLSASCGWASTHYGEGYVVEVPKDSVINLKKLAEEGWQPQRPEWGSDGIGTLPGLACVDFNDVPEPAQNGLVRHRSMARVSGGQGDYLFLDQRIVVGGFSAQNH